MKHFSKLNNNYFWVPSGRGNNLTYGQKLDIWIKETEKLIERYFSSYSHFTVCDYCCDIVKFRVVKDMNAITIVVHMDDIVFEKLEPMDIVLEILEVRTHVR